MRATPTDYAPVLDESYPRHRQTPPDTACSTPPSLDGDQELVSQPAEQASSAGLLAARGVAAVRDHDYPATSGDRAISVDSLNQAAHETAVAIAEILLRAALQRQSDCRLALDALAQPEAAGPRQEPPPSTKTARGGQPRPISRPTPRVGRE